VKHMKCPPDYVELGCINIFWVYIKTARISYMTSPEIDSIIDFTWPSVIGAGILILWLVYRVGYYDRLKPESMPKPQNGALSTLVHHFSQTSTYFTLSFIALTYVLVIGILTISRTWEKQSGESNE
jgi:hypothetical protein